MSEAPGPTPQDIEEMLAFLPVFGSLDFHPVKQSYGGTASDGTMQLTWPEYQVEVEGFIQVASRDCWHDRHYPPEAMALMIADPEKIAGATLDRVRSVLTHFVRGERFCDGHIGERIEPGRLAQILERPKEIADGQRLIPGSQKAPYGV